MGLFAPEDEIPREKEINPPPASQPEPAPSAPAPKRRGRPPGSKNRAKGEESKVAIGLDSLPAEVIEPLVMAPLIIVKMAVIAKTLEKDKRGNVTRKPIVMQYDEKTCQAAATAFKAWLASVDFALTPGWAYIAATGLALGSAMPALIMEIKERKEQDAKEEKTNSEATPAPANQGKPTEPTNANGPANPSNANGGSVSPDSAS